MQAARRAEAMGPRWPCLPEDDLLAHSHPEVSQANERLDSTTTMLHHLIVFVAAGHSCSKMLHSAGPHLLQLTKVRLN
jgi:hypothetical protein